MKIPKEVKRYCPHCKKHTLQRVTQHKTGALRSTTTKGGRRHERRGGIHGYGGFPRPKIENSSRHRIKTSKRPDIRFECKECKKKNVYKNSVRAKKFEIVSIGGKE
ncbi:50S ribosomal protein L44e [Candidatus Tiddalikarchaeum anstoanum]|nr:50S ribosomal protein L44e [Candidatus Tiddalikarchaeum anstoanum]